MNKYDDAFQQAKSQLKRIEAIRSNRGRAQQPQLPPPTLQRAANCPQWHTPHVDKVLADFRKCGG